MKKRNAPDATLRNVRASRTREKQLAARLLRIENAIADLQQRAFGRKPVATKS